MKAVVVAWGVLLAALTALMIPFGEAATAYLLLGGAAAATVVGAVLLRRSDRGVPYLSYATALVAAGVAALLLGAELGAWLLWIGGGCVLIGAAWAVGER